MPRVKYVKARKDYPSSGIKKGDHYYIVSLKTGPRSSKTMRSLKPFKQSQLTTSEFMSRMYELQERLEDFDGEIADLNSFLTDLAEEARELGQEQQEKFNNMPESLQMGDTGQLLEERGDAMEAWADSLDQAASTAEDKASEFEEAQKEWDEYNAQLAKFDEDETGAVEAPTEPDSPLPEEEELIQEVLDEIEEPSL